MDDLYNRLFKLLHDKSLYKDSVIDSEILDNIQNIFNYLISLKDYRKLTTEIHKLEIVFDKFELLSVSYLIFYFLDNINNIINVKKIENEISIDYDYNKKDLYMKVFENILVSIKKEYSFTHKCDYDINYDDKFLKETLIYFVEIFQATVNKLTSTNEDLDFQSKLLFVIRNICLKINNNEYFYLLAMTFIEYLNHAQELQLCRDVSEELILSSFNDNLCELGYFVMFKTYSMQQKNLISLIWQILFVKKIVSLNKCSNLLLKKFLFQTQRFFRNIGFLQYENDVYNFIRTHIILSEYEFHELMHSHFLALFSANDPKIVNEVYVFLVNNKEDILNYHIESSASRWLILLLNIKTVFHNIDTSDFDIFIALFKNIVPKYDIELIQSITLGKGNIKKTFIDNLLLINKTRFKEDLVYDTERTIIIANKLIKNSFDEQNPEGILLASLVKSDMSFNYIEKSINTPDKSRRIVEESEIQNLNNIKIRYENYQNYFEDNIIINDNDILVILFKVTNNIYKLTFNKIDKYSEIECFTGWDDSKEWINDEDLISFNNEDFVEDQEESSEKIKNKLLNYKLETEYKNVLLIKDISLSKFPNYLFISKNNYLSIQKNITQLFSLDWYIDEIQKKNKILNISPKLWIALGEKDITLNLLYSNLDKCISNYKIEVVNDIIPKYPINNDINIFIAHGPEEISSTNIIYSNHKPIINLDKIIGQGKLALLFICYSGSMKKGLYSNSVSTLIKKFLDRNYSTIIAPFWPLNIYIPPIWLPIFLDNLRNGRTVSESMFNANNEVYKKYKHPGAWACLHLYGNPYLKYEKE